MNHSKLRWAVAFTLAAWLACSALPTQGQAVIPPNPQSDIDPLSTLDSRAAHPPVPALRPATAAANRYLTVPDDFPPITVATSANDTAPGLIFASAFPWGTFNMGYLMILDNTGEPVYYQRLAGHFASDFKVLPSGNLTYYDTLRNAAILMDNTYQEVGTLRPGNGKTQFDLHEVLLLKNGHYLLMANELVHMDMSQIVPGGNPQAEILQQVVQEVDLDQNVYFEWPILQYIPVTDTTVALTDAQIDYSHCNALEEDTDGNILISCRHLDAIYKIDRSTKAVLWHLGGAQNDFTFATGPGITDTPNFYHQHDVRRLANGHISLFDNHNDHAPIVSRALEYAVSEHHRTATLVRAQHNSPDVFTLAMGNVQTLLPSGNKFVGWGSNLTPSLTEFHPDGSKALEMSFNAAYTSYRAYRFPWEGHPTWPPVLVVQPSGAGVKLTFSWNGATNVANYRIYGGDTMQPSALVGQTAKAGFETSAQLDGAQSSYCYYQVVPVDATGQTGTASNVAFHPTSGNTACFHTYFPLTGN